MSSIFQQAVDDIILQGNENENKKLTVKNETHEHENTDIDIYEEELYDLDKLSLDEK